MASNRGPFLVFAGDFYYPEGGADDLILVTDDREVAITEAQKAVVEAGNLSWGQVYDLEARKTIVSINWLDIDEKPTTRFM
jgi:hypothetical protein